MHGPLQPNDAPADEKDAFSPGLIGKERRTEIIANIGTDYETRSRRAEHLPHPTRARTVFSHHRQLEGCHPSATDTRPVTPVTSKSQPSIFYSSKPSKQTLSTEGS